MIKIQMRRYLHQIKRNLKCPRKEKANCLQYFIAEVNDYWADHPKASIRELPNVFSDPKEVADGFLQQMNPLVIKKYSRKALLLRILSSLIF